MTPRKSLSNNIARNGAPSWLGHSEGVRDGKVAAGALAEVKMAQENGRPVVLIGMTGGAAAQLWEEMRNGEHGHSAAFEVLGNADASLDALSVALGEILNQLNV